MKCYCRPKGVLPWRPCLQHFGQLSRREKQQVKKALGMR